MKINKNICKSFKIVKIKISSGGGDGSCIVLLIEVIRDISLQ